jgi:spermidine synthase
LDVRKDTYYGAPDFERWNTFSRVAVSTKYEGRPFGWGFGGDHSHLRVEQRLLTIDADASTVLTRWRGDVGEIAYLKDDIVNLGYHVRCPTDIAILGVGGGRDILSAIAFGATHIDGIELNPAIIEALTTRFAEFTGYFTRLPQVHLANADARAFINQTAHNYDLVQISLTDTWAATAAGGLTLSENKLYTVEAWRECLAKLRRKGMLTVTRWFVPGSHEGEFYRLLVLGAEALKCEGVRPEALRRHMLAATVGGVVTLAVSKTPFDERDVARFEEATRTNHYSVLLSPTEAYDEVTRAIATGRATEELFRSLPIDVTAPTDNRPFFFHMVPLWKGVDAVWDLKDSMNFKNDVASLVLVMILGVTLICTVILVILPLWAHVALESARTALPNLSYFACIGAGFMLIEVSQMQRLMIFLGHPVYGLSVVLFTLLLSAGAGSYTVKVAPTPGRAWIRPLVLCLLLAAAGIATPVVTGYTKQYETGVRVAVSALLLAPSGVMMGMMFPLGIALSKTPFTRMLPWFWGINGAIRSPRLSP